MELQPRRELAKVGAAFAILALALFWRVFLRGETLVAADFLRASPVWQNPPGDVRNPYLSDTVEYYYPAEKYYSESVRRGELPLSNPYVFNGAPVPHGAHIWNSVWPVKIAFLLAFEPHRSYDLFAISHWWLAAVAFYALLRGLGVEPFAAFAGALAYALSGRAMLWLHGHYLMPTMAYAPLAFLAARKGSPLAALPLAGLFFTNPQMALAVCAAVLVFAPRAWKAVGLAALLAAVALVPLFETVRNGMRSPLNEASFFYRDGWRSWLLLAGLVAPDVYNGSMPPNEYNIYLGLLPLLGALAGLRRDRYFAGLAGVGLAVATCYPLPVWAAPVSFSLPTRYLFFFTLGACVCFARALDRLPLRGWMKAAVVALILVDLGPRFVRWNSTHDPSLLKERPPVVDVLKGRVGWVLGPHPALGRAVLPPLWMFGVPSVQGYDVTVPRAHADALRGAAEVNGDREIRIREPESPLLDAAGMKYLITQAPFAARRFRQVWAGGVFVYENPSAGDVPPRRVPAWPAAAGLGITLAACALGILWGARLDRSGRRGYS